MIKKKIILFVLLIGFITSCGVYNSLMNLSKLKFKLGSVNNFQVGSMLITNKSKLSDFAATDLLKLTSQVISGKFPVTFTVNVLAQNPNTSSGSGEIADISLQAFPWTLYINDKKTISGNISSPVSVPAVEGVTTIPLQMQLDLLDYFQGDGLNELVNLALKLGGQKGSPSNIKIVAEPVLGTPIGNMSYPSPLTIVDQSFN
ncbi:MAG: hypothetical protein KDC67_08765 [Ignavibacteriae bacterium]|nr:hypothetical protein [Ignavibacteriota bacterium]MCB0749014.1 hypothetical protein [Ignavibacteriota bacterium]